MLNTFPDQTICRTRYYRKHVWECKANIPSSCPYAIGIADRLFCTHLNSAEFCSNEKPDIQIPNAEDGIYRRKLTDY